MRSQLWFHLENCNESNLLMNMNDKHCDFRHYFLLGGSFAIFVTVLVWGTANARQTIFVSNDGTMRHHSAQLRDNSCQYGFQAICVPCVIRMSSALIFDTSEKSRATHARAFTLPPQNSVPSFLNSTLSVTSKLYFQYEIDLMLQCSIKTRPSSVCVR